MNRVYITDYIETPDIERDLLGDDLCSEINSSIEVILVWKKKVNKS